MFTNLRLARIVVQSLIFLQKRGEAISLAYVLMPDHLHWLVRLPENCRLDALMRSMKRYTARRINEQLGRIDQPVWQSGYYDHGLRTEEDVLKVARYLVENPLRAGLCEGINDYSHWDTIWFL